MTVAEIIEMCGGEHAIVFRLKLSDKYVVRKWEQRGIPLNKWSALFELAEENGNQLDPQMLWQASEAATRGETEPRQS